MYLCCQAETVGLLFGLFFLFCFLRVEVVEQERQKKMKGLFSLRILCGSVKI